MARQPGFYDNFGATCFNEDMASEIDFSKSDSNRSTTLFPDCEIYTCIIFMKQTSKNKNDVSNIRKRSCLLKCSCERN